MLISKSDECSASASSMIPTMCLDADACYRATRLRYSRFDGRFFIAVSSTRIYCRPVCTVKPPKRENCSFFPSAAAAEAQGYRPCLRCRPELAPGNASVGADYRIAAAAATLIEDGADANLEAIAARLGIAESDLRRAFQAEFGVAPDAFAQTQRLLLAKRLLTDTACSATEIAHVSGFGSARRLNELFERRYRLSPSRIRKVPPRASYPSSMMFELGYRPPYDWNSMLAFLAARAIKGVEEIDGAAYRRTVHLSRDGKDHAGWIEITPVKGKAALRLVLSASLFKVLPAVLGRVKHLMDLSSNPTEVAEALGPLAALNPGLRVPGAFDGFEIGVRAILGQQVTVAGARTIAGRFAAAFGTPIASPFPSITTVFPSPQRVAALTVDDIARLGVIASRSRSIIALARAVSEGAIDLSFAIDVAAEVEKLRALPGIGEWTAQYIAMRALKSPDAFPHTDLGVMKALGETNPRRVLEAGETWQPWRSYAVMHLWQSLQ